MLEQYMQAMASVINGRDAQALKRLKGTGFDPKFVTVYRNNFICALSEVLEANYLSVLNVVGDDYFLKLAKLYIDKYPAVQRTLVSYGKDFDSIIDKDKPNHRLPYLGDFARLDREWTLAHTAKNTAPLEMQTLTNMAQSGGDLEGVKLTLIPSASVIALDWPIFNLWKSIRNDDAITDNISIDKIRQYVLVWRYELAVNYRVLEPAEYDFLSAIQNGRNLGEAMASAMASLPSQNPDFDITTLLPNAIGAKLFTDINPE